MTAITRVTTAATTTAIKTRAARAQPRGASHIAGRSSHFTGERMPSGIINPQSIFASGKGRASELFRALARDGYDLVKCELAVFKPEAWWSLPFSGELWYFRTS